MSKVSHQNTHKKKGRVARLNSIARGKRKIDTKIAKEVRKIRKKPPNVLAYCLSAAYKTMKAGAR